MTLTIFIRASVCTLILLTGSLPAAARMASSPQGLSSHTSELLFKQALNGINIWLSSLLGRIPSDDQVSEQMEVRIQSLRAAFPSTLSIASKNELEERVSSILSNIRSVLNEYTAQQNSRLDLLYKHINDWRKTFTTRQPTAEEQKSKLAEAFKELDTHTKALQDRLKIYELTSMLPATLDIITKQDTLTRQHISAAITQPIVPSTPSEPLAKTSAAPTNISALLERELPSFISTVTQPFILGSKDSLAPWLLGLFGWREAFTSSPDIMGQWKPTLTSNGSTLATSNHDGIVTIFAHDDKEDTYKKVYTSPDHFSAANLALVLSGDGSILATSNQDGVVNVLERHGTTYRQLFTSPSDFNSGHTDLALSHNGSILATSNNGHINILERKGYTYETLFTSPPDTIGTIGPETPILTSDGSILATSNDEGIIRIFARDKAGTYQQMYTSLPRYRGSSNLVLSRDESIIATVGSDGTVRLIAREDRTYKPIYTSPSRIGGDMDQVVLNNNGSIFAILNNEGLVRIFARDKDGNYTQRFVSPFCTATNPVLSSDGAIVAIANAGGIVSLFARSSDGSTYRPLWTSPPDIISNRSPILSSDGSILITANYNGVVRIFARNQDNTYKPIFTSPPHISNGIITFTSNGIFATSDHRGIVRIFKPSVNTTLYKNLSIQQLNFLHDLYSLFTSSTHPIKIKLTREQSKLWWSLPPAMINVLTHNRWGVVKAIPEEKLTP